MGIDKKRDEVLRKLYDDVLLADADDAPKLAETIKVIEAARIAEKELGLKDEVALLENANKQIEREHEDRNRMIEIAVNAVLAIGSGLSGLLWAAIFVTEMSNTRRFEETGTETSAASRWLKNAFPKPRVY